MYWTNQSINWYHNAAKTHQFHQVIANEIIPYLDKNDIVADIGCGLAYLDRAISHAISQIYAIDNERAVIEDINSYPEHNLTTIEGDYKEVLPEGLDVIIMSFFAKLCEQFEWIQARSNRLIITIKNTERTVYDLANQRALKREIHSDIVEFCQYHKIDYIERIIKLPFGQPFRELDDVEAYLERYKPLEKGNYSAYIKQHLKRDYSAKFPFYLPKEKSIGICIINTRTNT